MGNLVNKANKEEFLKIQENLKNYLNFNSKDNSYIATPKKSKTNNNYLIEKSNLRNKIYSNQILNLTLNITDNLSINPNNMNFVGSTLFSNIYSNYNEKDFPFIQEQNLFLDELINEKHIFDHNSKYSNNKENISIKLEESLRSSKIIPSNSIKSNENKTNMKSQIHNFNDIFLKEKGKVTEKVLDSLQEINNSIIGTNIDSKKASSKELTINNSRITSKITITKKTNEHTIKNVSPLKNKKNNKTKKSNKPAVVNIKIDLRDIQREHLIENYLNKSRINSSISPSRANNYTTKSKSPDPRDTSFKVFIEKCTHANENISKLNKETDKFERKSYLLNSNMVSIKSTYTEKLMTPKSKYTKNENNYVIKNTSNQTKQSYKESKLGFQKNTLKNKNEIVKNKPNIANLYKKMKKLNEENSQDSLDNQSISNQNHIEKSIKINKNCENTEIKCTNIKNDNILIEDVKVENKLLIKEKITEKIFDEQNESFGNNIKTDTKKDGVEFNKTNKKKTIIMEIKGPYYDEKPQNRQSENKRYSMEENSLNSLDIHNNLYPYQNNNVMNEINHHDKNSIQFNRESKFNSNNQQESEEDSDEISNYYRKNKKNLENIYDEKQFIHENLNDDEEEEEEENETYKFKVKNKIKYNQINSKITNNNEHKITEKSSKLIDNITENSIKSLKNDTKSNKNNKMQIYRSKNLDDNDFLNY